MAYIYYRLNHSANLGTMVPPALGGGAFGVAAVPAGLVGAGIYIIINTQGGVATHNRYIGISSNLATRFAPRMSVITELGFSAAAMNQIHVVWGTVKVRNHPLAMGTATSVTTLLNGPPATVPFPSWAAPGWTLAIPAGGGAAFTAVADGNVINLEHLLIRFVMSRLGTGGTVSNNLLMAPFVHPSPMGMGAPPIDVKFYSAPFGAYNGFTAAARLAPGFVF